MTNETINLFVNRINTVADSLWDTKLELKAIALDLCAYKTKENPTDNDVDNIIGIVCSCGKDVMFYPLTHSRTCTCGKQYMQKYNGATDYPCEFNTEKDSWQSFKGKILRS